MADLTLLANGQGSGAHQVLNEVPIALVGGSAARTGVGLSDHPGPFQFYHLVAHRGGTDVEGVMTGYVLGRYGVSSRDILFDYDGKYSALPVAEIGVALRVHGRQIGSFKNRIASFVPLSSPSQRVLSPQFDYTT